VTGRTGALTSNKRDPLSYLTLGKSSTAGESTLENLASNFVARGSIQLS
jgi:hypothetical protein